MELNKLTKRKDRAKNEKNQQAVAAACNKLGDYYMIENQLDKALDEFSEAAEIFRLESMKMDEGRAIRMKGEVYLKQNKLHDALKCIKKYLKVAREESNQVESQRAHTTLGRCYLMIAEDSCLNSEAIKSSEEYKAAEKEFLKGLLACKDLGKLVPKYEVADMKARSYFNLGMLNEHKSSNDAIENYETAIKICKSNDIFDIQHTSLMALGFCYATKKNDSVAALQTYNNALEVANRIADSKNEKICETLLAKGTLLIKNGDFQSAKQALKKAYKMRTTIEADKMTIQKQFKVVNALCRYEDELITTDSFEYAKRKELFDKIGDLAWKLKNYTKAIDCYKKMLEAAELNGETGKKLIPIYISLYETYIDGEDYEHALKFLHKEYELIKDVPSEACPTLLRIASVLEKAKKDFWEIEETYRKALAATRLVGNSTIEEGTILRKLISLCKENKMTSLAEILEQEALEKNIDITTKEDDVDDIEYSEEIPIDDEFLELSSDADSSDENDTTITQNKSIESIAARGRKRRSMTVKKNAKGETKLHEACIAGNYQLAKMLLEQGHPVNVRDNAGWLTIHEAANHGHRDIVELLLDHGATINDRGGTNCDGISPLYDAASNGHLRVVHLLLDRGAKATIKTDANQTPLDGLRWWYANEADNGKSLSDAQRNLYDEISARLVEQCERIGIDTNNKNLLPLSLASSGIGSMSQGRRFNTNFSSESGDESDSENRAENSGRLKRNAGEEYRDIIKCLRNPYQSERKLEECDTFMETKKRSAYLTETEIDPSDWLENDLGPVKKKQKFFGENSLKTSKESSRFQEPSPQKINFVLEPITNNVILDSDERESIIDDYEDVNIIDAFDVMMSTEGGAQQNVKRKSRRNSQTKLSQTKSQSSLFDAGFSRFIDTAGEAIFTTSSRPSSHNSSLTSFNISGSMEREKQTTTTTTIVKVQIENEKIIVPIYQDVANVVKISWLIEEAAKRYYSLKGIRPELKLKTADGATLLESDTLSVILCLKEENLILSEVLDWKLPSLSNRYLEACSELKCAVDQDINDILDLHRAAISLDLSNQNLRPSNVRPILKALQHQNCLSQLDLSSNFIQDEGTKYLSNTLITLRHLIILDLSGNAITENGIEQLCSLLIKSNLPTEIKCLKLNSNPIKSLSFLSELCSKKSITSLELVNCELESVGDGVETLNSLKELDLSNNHLTRIAVKEILGKLNPTIFERINLERCSQDINMGDSLVDFLMLSSNSLKQLNLSGLKLSENEILAVLRSLEGCKNLRHLDLSFQKELSFTALKYILLNLGNKNLQVNLKGCRNLQNVSNLFSHCDSPTHLPCQVLLSIPRTTTTTPERERNDYIGKMRDLWNDLSEARGITQVERNTLRLIIDCCT